MTDRSIDIEAELVLYKSAYSSLFEILEETREKLAELDLIVDGLDIDDSTDAKERVNNIKAILARFGFDLAPCDFGDSNV